MVGIGDTRAKLLSSLRLNGTGLGCYPELSDLKEWKYSRFKMVGDLISYSTFSFLQIILQIYWFVSNPEAPCVCLFSLLKEYFFVCFVIWGYELIFVDLYLREPCRFYV